VETLISGLLAAAATGITTGITIVAYKHPTTFKALKKYINIILLCGVAGGKGYEIGVIITNHAISGSDRITLEAKINIDDMINAIGLPWWFWPTVLLISLYIGFLSTFPYWRHGEKNYGRADGG
jgi:hypothetical protein